MHDHHLSSSSSNSRTESRDEKKLGSFSKWNIKFVNDMMTATEKGSALAGLAERICIRQQLFVYFSFD